jgi:hypothetical protein
MARPRSEPIPYSAPKKGEPSQKCEGCDKLWPIDLMVMSVLRCRNCARKWWREAQAAHRSGASAPPLRRAAAAPELPPDIDGFLASVCDGAEAPRRVPLPPQERHSPDESIDNIVSRMGAEVIDVPLLSAPKKRP